MNDEKSLTPLMRQYFDIKTKYPDTILLFQVGDFYELFFDDAVNAAAVLGIALTQRGTHKGAPIPLCGVPLHVVDLYLSKLVRAGFKVALCDQLEQPRPGKVVDRGVTQVLTPGTLTDSKLLDEKSASYLAVFFPTETSWAFVCAELLTGQLFVTLINKSIPVLEAELNRFMPDEIVVPQTKQGAHYASLFQTQGYAVSHEPFVHNAEAVSCFTQHASSLPQSESLHNALMVLYSYLKRNNEQGLAELKSVSFYKPEDYLMLDAATQRNLELVKNTQDGSGANTLFAVLDKAVTPMGSRMIKKWILRPLVKKEQIEERLQAVELFLNDHLFKSDLRKLLQSVGDLERIVGRIALKRAQLYDYQALLKALGVVPLLRALLATKGGASLLATIAGKIPDFMALTVLLESSLNDDQSKEWLIKPGYDAELDRIRKLVEQGSHAIFALEAQEQKRTGINSLKIRYNQVHGYGIEVTNPNLHLVPPEYLRIQTLANRERFTTQELKDLEYDLQRARNEITQIEKEAYQRVKDTVELSVPMLKKAAHALAYSDALAALSEVAYSQSYVRPTFNEEHEITIIEGRHPVVELRLQAQFIPNTVQLHNESALWLITGPNMGGKSTFLRQTALITLMAHMGSFVPAKKAHIALIDRIFTRIGAADNMAEGKSTFLVEMEETALICQHATKNSLVILDEVGRGTSTFDGLAIAQAVVEYLYTHNKARCLFATHYHELTALCEKFTGIKPYFAASSKTAQGVVLLHKIMAGIADGSFGLEVAAAAQLPTPLITRAREILTELTHNEKHVFPATFTTDVIPKDALKDDKEYERERFIAAELAQIDCESLTARQALDLVWRLKESLK